MVRKPAHRATPQDALTILATVQPVADDAQKVEMPIERLYELFDIRYPLNVLTEDGSATIVNGFSKTDVPPTVNFYVSRLAEVAGISVDAAKEKVAANGVRFEKQTAGKTAGITSILPGMGSSTPVTR